MPAKNLDIYLFKDYNRTKVPPLEKPKLSLIYIICNEKEIVSTKRKMDTYRGYAKDILNERILNLGRNGCLIPHFNVPSNDILKKTFVTDNRTYIGIDSFEIYGPLGAKDISNLVKELNNVMKSKEYKAKLSVLSKGCLG